jgi:hypothetical protein
MILRFKTKINKNGNKRYLTIDTEEKTLNRNVNLFEHALRYEIKKTDMNDIIENCKIEGYTEV